MDSTISIIVGGVIGALVVGLIALILSKKSGSGDNDKTDDKSFLLLQNQISDLTKTIDSRLSESRKEMTESVRTQFSESSKIIRDVTDRLAKLDETNKQVISFTDQLKSLQDILKNPKQRGILGEYYLETLLKNVLPPGSYQMQYAFKDGEIVDAIVRVREHIVPVDSKFSLENYNRIVDEQNQAERDRLEKLFVNDLKLRIKETSKYIRPNEGTTEFAFMFIPHEAIYYDLLINKIGGNAGDEGENLIQKAANTYKVIIVSPTSFLAYLQTVLQGLKALKIEESAKEIRKRVEDLGKHISTYDRFMNKLGGTLGTTVSHYNSAYKEFKKIDKDVLRISGVGGDVETVSLEKPNLEE